jgi:hypothetical protein
MLRSELRTILRSLQREDVGDPAGLRGLPELPLRFPLRLTAPDRELFDQYKNLEQLPDLVLTEDLQLLWPGHGVMGRFAGRELSILRRLGEWHVIYTPRILEISSSGWVAVELVRPLLSVCPSCSRVYPQGFRVCERDRRPLVEEQGTAPHVDFVQLREEMQRNEDE